MCGIVGAACSCNTRDILLRGLAALEYRGYDSAGLAFSGAKVQRIACAGRVSSLSKRSGDGFCGIGHTRWATHGAPTARNAHPVACGRAAVVHNGIIENHAVLRARLEKDGRSFRTDTDTEVAAQLLDIALAGGATLERAMRETAAQLKGAFALAAIAAGCEEIAFARQGSPLLIGKGQNGFFVSSDAQALAGAAGSVALLEDGDCGALDKNGARITSLSGGAVSRKWRPAPRSAAATSLEGRKHFMEKEIFEQPRTTAAAVKAHIRGAQVIPESFGRGAASAFRRARSVVIIACGTSYHAALIARNWLQRLGAPCRAEVASEYRHGADPEAKNSLALAVSQSGETADTLAALRAAKAAGARTMALVNAPDSALEREADFVMHTCAGPEICVASTKCFTAQLAQLLAFSLAFAKARGSLSVKEERNAVRQIRALPAAMRRALALEPHLKKWAKAFARAPGSLFIGRGAHYPLALEGALKLKEISYAHAEGCAAGELKHGLLALIDEKMPVAGVAPDDALLPKMESSLAEVAARKGKLFVLAGARASVAGAEVLRLDDGGEWISPMTFAIPLQLLAYHAALLKGTDIDKPRNLAKSVTVE